MIKNDEGIVRVQKQYNNANVTRRSIEAAVGYDLNVAKAAIVPVKGKSLVKTKFIHLETKGLLVLNSTAFRITLKIFVDAVEGVSDQDCRSEIGVEFCNSDKNDFEIRKYIELPNLFLKF